MCVCLYVRTLREAALFKFFDISCSLSKPWLSPLQVPSPRCLGKRFSWLFRLNENRCLSTIEMHCDGRCTLYVILPFPSDLCPSKQLLPIRHAHRKQVGELPVSFPRQSDRPLSLLSFWGHNFFVNNVHLIDVTIHCFAPYFLFVKQITPVNFPNWQWRMFGLPLNTLLLTLKIKMTMQKKRENRDSWIQKGWRGSAYGKILFLSIWKDWFH